MSEPNLFRSMRLEDVTEIIQMSKENMTRIIWAAWRVRLRDDIILEMLLDPEVMTEVMERDGALVGYYSIERRGCSVLVNSIQVKRGLRKRGYGRRMLERIEALAHISGTNSVELWVQNTNGDAFDFYRHFGYRFICKRGNNYLMRKHIRALEGGHGNA